MKGFKRCITKIIYFRVKVLQLKGPFHLILKGKERRKERQEEKKGGGKEENIKIYYVEPETCHFYISQTSMWNLLNAKRIVFIYQNISMNAAFHQGKEIFDPSYLPVLYV